MQTKNHMKYSPSLWRDAFSSYIQIKAKSNTLIKVIQFLFKKYNSVIAELCKTGKLTLLCGRKQSKLI